MDFDDRTAPMVWRDRDWAGNKTHPELIEDMKAEAAAEGYVPFDLNYDGRPNVYLRGRYALEDGDEDKPENWVHIADGFVMFVCKPASDVTGAADAELTPTENKALGRWIGDVRGFRPCPVPPMKALRFYIANGGELFEQEAMALVDHIEALEQKITDQNFRLSAMERELVALAKENQDGRKADD